MNDPILKCDKVSFTSAVPDIVDVRDFDCSLRSGTLALLWSDKGRRLPLADLATGIADPDGGEVSFLGIPWSGRGATEACEARARIGRVFARAGWISNLTVYENVVMCARNVWRGKSDADIHDAVLRLAAQVGLDEISNARPGAVLADTLQRSGWVRAFLGDRELLLLEYPEWGVDPAHLGALQRLVSEACACGRAVLWITREPTTWKSSNLKVTCRMKYQDGTVDQVTESITGSEG